MVMVVGWLCVIGVWFGVVFGVFCGWFVVVGGIRGRVLW